MVLEVTAFHIKPGMKNDFESRFRQASDLLARAPGYVRHELHKCVETDEKYLMMVQWRSIKHRAVFVGQSPHYVEWRALLDPLLDGEPVAEHYVSIRIQ
jgi:heme-degrading monooxygenase HmoA